MGTYNVRWWVPHHKDTNTRPLFPCRFWPDTRKRRADDREPAYIPVRPDKVKQALAENNTIIWPSYEVPLAEIRIAGPFDFTTERVGLRGPKRQAVSERFRIDEIYWSQLEKNAPQFNLDVSHIRITHSISST